MSDIKQALLNLKNAVGRLETSAQSVETASAGQQRDMFAAPAKKVANGNFTVDNAVIAQRLDKAIERVEEMLKG